MAQITPEEFAAGAKQLLGEDKAKPFTEAAPVPPPAPSTHWTARTDQLGAVRIAPRKGYGTESLFVWAFEDGSLVVDDTVLPPAAAARLITIWSARSADDRNGEFQYTASITKTLHARWSKWSDGMPCFQLHVYDSARTLSTERLSGISATGHEAVRALKELLLLRQQARG